MKQKLSNFKITLTANRIYRNNCDFRKNLSKECNIVYPDHLIRITMLTLSAYCIIWTNTQDEVKICVDETSDIFNQETYEKVILPFYQKLSSIKKTSQLSAI